MTYDVNDTRACKEKEKMGWCFQSKHSNAIFLLTPMKNDK